LYGRAEACQLPGAGDFAVLILANMARISGWHGGNRVQQCVGLVGTEPMHATPVTSAPQILLVDDSPIERLALAHFLRGSGYRVDEAADGDAAILQLKHREVDLLLLDLQMPEVDGFAVLSYVQEHRRSLPVILLSGMPPHKIQHKMHVLRERELPPLMLKPIDPAQLLGVVELQLLGALPGPEDAVDHLDHR
jgi:two-component system OmpR family response regulator